MNNTFVSFYSSGFVYCFFIGFHELPVSLLSNENRNVGGFMNTLFNNKQAMIQRTNPALRRAREKKPLYH